MSKFLEPDVILSNKVSEKDCKMYNITQKQSIFKANYFKKYAYAIAAIGLGLFIGGSVAGGIFVGLFGGAVTKLSIDRTKETAPAVYNWMLDNPGKMEFITALSFAGFFGLTATGIVGGLVTNILSSVVLDYYAEKEGRIEGVEKLTFSGVIKSFFKKIKNLFSNLKEDLMPSEEVVVPNQEIIENKSEVPYVDYVQHEELPCNALAA